MEPIPQHIADRLLHRDPPPPLRPAAVYDPALTARIDALEAPALVKMGLHLLNDDLSRSHVLAQSLEGDPTADYWHALVHRREGDWSNAQYWFRRVGPHPVLTALYGDDSAAPAAFVDRCRAVDRGQDAALEAAQLSELSRLLAYAGANGG